MLTNKLRLGLEKAGYPAKLDYVSGARQRLRSQSQLSYTYRPEKGPSQFR